MATSLLLALMIFQVQVNGQDDYKLGVLKRTDLLSYTCIHEPSAEAYYILNYGRTRIVAPGRVVTERLIRLKINSKSELDRGNFEIPYLINGAVRNIKGFTYNIEDGISNRTELGKENIFEEKIDKKKSKVIISFPNVKEGSVIELGYEVESGEYRSLETWYFQHSIPVQHSEYHLYIPEYFDYQRLQTGFVGLDVADITNENGRWGSLDIYVEHNHYEARYVPSFIEEPHSPPKVNLISKIDFELRTVSIPGILYENFFPESYGALTQVLMNSKYWTNDISRAPWAKELLESFHEDQADSLVVAKRIFDFIKGLKKSPTESKSLAVAFKEQSATDVEMNRMMIAILRQAGYKVKPVWISTREHGVLNPYFPMTSGFNFILALLTLNGQDYLLDASENEHHFGMLPEYCLNGKGLIIHDRPVEWIDLQPYAIQGDIWQAKIELLDSGALSGELIIRHNGYSAADLEHSLVINGQEAYLKQFESEHGLWSIDSHKLEKPAELIYDEIIYALIQGETVDLGSTLYLSPTIHDVLNENPFKAESREYPIDMVLPKKFTYIAEIQLPDSYTVESIPETLTLMLPGKAAMFSYKVTHLGSKLILNQQFQINHTIYSADDYDFLRGFYAQAIEKNNEQIVLSKK